MSRSATPTSLQRSVGSAGDLITRNQLIAWINGRLESNFASFEDLRSGEAYCDLLRKLRSGSLPPKKVRRGARSEHDRVLNFKLLQQGLDKARMRREFRKEGLVAGRFRDHYELLKWFRRLFDATHANRTRSTLPGPAAPLGQHRDAARRPSSEPQDEVEKIEELADDAAKECDIHRLALRSIENMCRASEDAGSTEEGSLVDEIIDVGRHPAQVCR
ncbi:microtubule-associated protein RP/EB family member 1-like [Haemaphysalis longicornis]